MARAPLYISRYNILIAKFSKGVKQKKQCGPDEGTNERRRCSKTCVMTSSHWPRSIPRSDNREKSGSFPTLLNMAIFFSSLSFSQSVQSHYGCGIFPSPWLYLNVCSVFFQPASFQSVLSAHGWSHTSDTSMSTSFARHDIK